MRRTFTQIVSIMMLTKINGTELLISILQETQLHAAFLAEDTFMSFLEESSLIQKRSQMYVNCLTLRRNVGRRSIFQNETNGFHVIWPCVIKFPPQVY